MSSKNDRRRHRPDAPRIREAEGLGQVLEGLLDGAPWRAGVALGGLARRWAEVVGERLAEESWPGSLQGDVLTVRVSSSAWAAQVGFLAKEVARRANEVLGGALVGSIRVVVDLTGTGGGRNVGAAG